MTSSCPSYRRHRFPAEIISPLRVAMLPLLPELPRYRGDAGQAWHYGWLRNCPPIRAVPLFGDTADVMPLGEAAAAHLRRGESVLMSSEDRQSTRLNSSHS